MAWNTPITDWANNDLVSASHLNNIGNNLVFLHEPAFVNVSNSASISIPNNTERILTFNTETNKTVDSMHSTSTQTGRLKAPYTGLYLIHARVRWQNYDVGYREIRILDGGASVAVTHLSVTDGPEAMEVSTLRRLSANDYVELEVIQDSQITLDVTFTASGTRFEMVYLGVV